jgi:hypothetical protein
VVRFRPRAARQEGAPVRSGGDHHQQRVTSFWKFQMPSDRAVLQMHFCQHCCQSACASPKYAPNWAILISDSAHFENILITVVISKNSYD